MSAKTKITSKGQVTIPHEIRKAMKMQEGDYLIFEAVNEYEANVKVVRSKPLSTLLGALESPEDKTEMHLIREQARDALATRRSNN